MSRLSAILDLMDGKPSASTSAKRPRDPESKDGAPPAKLPRFAATSAPTRKPPSTSPKNPKSNLTSQPSSKKSNINSNSATLSKNKALSEKNDTLDEDRAMRVISIELDLLMGRRTATVPLALLRNEWRPLPKGDTRPRTLLSLEDAPQGLVSSPSLCASLTSLLRACPFLAVDCEWSGESLSTVQVASPGAHVFVFDVLGDGGKAMFDAGLRDLLQDDSVVKVLHDCRQDALFLARHGGVNLKPVIDTQIAFAFVTRLRTSGTPLPCALNTVLRVFAQGSENAYKEHARALMEADKEIWAKRPLDEILLAYAMDDVRSLPRAYVNASAALGESNLLLVREYSTSYSNQLKNLTQDELLVREERYKRDKEAGAERPVPKYNIARWDEEAASNLRGPPPPKPTS